MPRAYIEMILSSNPGKRRWYESAKVFEDRISPGDWRVEKIDDDGGIEVAIFAGPQARDRAIEYANWRCSGDFKEVNLSPLRAG
jgi:hypothetical protein